MLLVIHGTPYVHKRPIMAQSASWYWLAMSLRSFRSTPAVGLGTTVCELWGRCPCSCTRCWSTLRAQLPGWMAASEWPAQCMPQFAASNIRCIQLRPRPVYVACSIMHELCCKKNSFSLHQSKNTSGLRQQNNTLPMSWILGPKPTSNVMRPISSQSDNVFNRIRSSTMMQFMCTFITSAVTELT